MFVDKNSFPASSSVKVVFTLYEHDSQSLVGFFVMKKWTHWELKTNYCTKLAEKILNIFNVKYLKLSIFFFINTNRKQIYIFDIEIASTPAKDLHP